MWNFQEVFLIIPSLFANLKLMSVLFIHETFFVYKLETLTDCKEVKHIMIMIIAPPPLPPIKNPPLFTHSPTKNLCMSPYFCQYWKFFRSLLTCIRIFYCCCCCFCVGIHSYGVFNCYLAGPWLTFGRSLGNSLANLMLITALQRLWSGYCEPYNKVGSLKPSKDFVGLEVNWEPSDFNC